MRKNSKRRNSLNSTKKQNFKPPKPSKSLENISTTKVRKPELRSLSSFDIANKSLKAFMELTISENFIDKYYHKQNFAGNNIADDVKDSLITNKDLIAEALIEEGAPDVADHLSLYITKFAKYLQKNPEELYNLCEEVNLSKYATVIHTTIKMEKI